MTRRTAARRTATKPTITPTNRLVDHLIDRDQTGFVQTDRESNIEQSCAIFMASERARDDQNSTHAHKLTHAQTNKHTEIESLYNTIDRRIDKCNRLESTSISLRAINTEAKH